MHSQRAVLSHALCGDRSYLRRFISLRVRFKEVIRADENSGAIYYTETYDRNMMVYAEYGLICIIALSDSGAMST